MPSAAEPQAQLNGGTHHRHTGEGGAPTVTPKRKLDIIDIRRTDVEINLKEEILTSFKSTDGPRTLPTLLLYDERGLKLFEEVSNSV